MVMQAFAHNPGIAERVAERKAEVAAHLLLAESQPGNKPLVRPELQEATRA